MGPQTFPQSFQWATPSQKTSSKMTSLHLEYTRNVFQIAGNCSPATSILSTIHNPQASINYNTMVQDHPVSNFNILDNGDLPPLLHKVKPIRSIILQKRTYNNQKTIFYCPKVISTPNYQQLEDNHDAQYVQMELQPSSSSQNWTTKIKNNSLYL